MLTEMAMISTIFFHRGDMVPAYEFTHYPCSIEPLYIHGLNETETYLEGEGIYLYEDRVVHHLNPRITHFEIRRNDDHQVIGELHIRWKTDCSNDDTTQLDKSPAASKDNVNSSTSTYTTKMASTKTTKKEQPTSNSSVQSSTGISKKTESILTHHRESKKTDKLLSIYDEEPRMKKTKVSLKMIGITKKTVYLQEPFNLLEDIYLFSPEGDDISHRLSHSPFAAEREGTYYIEIIGSWKEDEVRSLMEVVVKEREDSSSNALKYSWFGFSMIMSLLVAIGGSALRWKKKH